jgi:putative cardiolipin synthase
MPLAGARHFMSVPFLDGKALERYWIDLIDSARIRVEIVTPYLNPTPRIEAALNRALARGVEVMIVARIRLEGDLGGRLMTEMNMLFVERYADRMTLWEYDPPKVVLHSKMLMIDGRLAIVTSTNLNRRSFLHDTENGLAVLDPAFTRRLRAEVQVYIDQSRRLTPGDSDVRPIVRKLFSVPFVRDLF